MFSPVIVNRERERSPHQSLGNDGNQKYPDDEQRTVEPLLPCCQFIPILDVN
jgi:hypothetical protein